MDFLQKLNASSILDDRKPAKKLRELEKGHAYKICNCRVINSKFGDSVLIELEDFVTFLPKRVTENYAPHCEELSTGQYSLVYRGEVDTGKTNLAASFEIKRQ